MIEKLKLRFIPGDELTKAGGNKKLDLSLKCTKTWQSVVDYLEKKWCSIENLKSRICLYFVDLQGHESVNLVSAYVKFPVGDTLSLHPEMLKFINSSQGQTSSGCCEGPTIQIFYKLGPISLASSLPSLNQSSVSLYPSSATNLSGGYTKPLEEPKMRLESQQRTNRSKDGAWDERETKRASSSNEISNMQVSLPSKIIDGLKTKMDDMARDFFDDCPVPYDDEPVRAVSSTNETVPTNNKALTLDCVTEANKDENRRPIFKSSSGIKIGDEDSMFLAAGLLSSASKGSASINSSSYIPGGRKRTSSFSWVESQSLGGFGLCGVSNNPFCNPMNTAASSLSSGNVVTAGLPPLRPSVSRSSPASVEKLTAASENINSRDGRRSRELSITDSDSQGNGKTKLSKHGHGRPPIVTHKSTNSASTTQAIAPAVDPSATSITTTTAMVKKHVQSGAAQSLSQGIQSDQLVSVKRESFLDDEGSFLFNAATFASVVDYIDGVNNQYEVDFITDFDPTAGNPPGGTQQGEERNSRSRFPPALLMHSHTSSLPSAADSTTDVSLLIAYPEPIDYPLSSNIGISANFTNMGIGFSSSLAAGGMLTHQECGSPITSESIFKALKPNKSSDGNSSKASRRYVDNPMGGSREDAKLTGLAVDRKTGGGEEREGEGNRGVKRLLGVEEEIKEGRRDRVIGAEEPRNSLTAIGKGTTVTETTSLPIPSMSKVVGCSLEASSGNPILPPFVPLEALSTRDKSVVTDATENDKATAVASLSNLSNPAADKNGSVALCGSSSHQQRLHQQRQQQANTNTSPIGQEPKRIFGFIEELGGVSTNKKQRLDRSPVEVESSQERAVLTSSGKRSADILSSSEKSTTALAQDRHAANTDTESSSLEVSDSSRPSSAVALDKSKSARKNAVCDDSYPKASVRQKRITSYFAANAPQPKSKTTVGASTLLRCGKARGDAGKIDACEVLSGTDAISLVSTSPESGSVISTAVAVTIAAPASSASSTASSSTSATVAVASRVIVIQHVNGANVSVNCDSDVLSSLRCVVFRPPSDALPAPREGASMSTTSSVTSSKRLLSTIPTSIINRNCRLPRHQLMRRITPTFLAPINMRHLYVPNFSFES